MDQRRILLVRTTEDHPKYRQWVDGAHRYASARQWGVDVVPVAESTPEAVRAMVRKARPFGCIVESYSRAGDFPPETFAGARVCYLDPPQDKAPWPGFPFVVCDNRTVAEAAFRELSGTLPSSYAIVPSSTLRGWSRARVKAFKSLAAESGRPCRVFPVHAREQGDERTRHLKKWVAALPRGYAVFAVSDLLASIVAGVARAGGRSMPGDLTLIGADGRYEFEYAGNTAISTVNIDFERAGFLAAQALDHPEAKTLKFGPLLVARHASTGGRGRREVVIRDAVDVIRREACDGLTAAALAARFPGSRNLFERRFREAMGHSVLDEIIHVRLEKAFAMLAMTDVPIGAISDFCGFGCDSDLRKLFRAKTGTSMRQWRASRRTKIFS